MIAAWELAWVKYPLAATVATVFLAAVGTVPTLWARRSLPEWGWLLTPIMGMAWLSIVVSWYSDLHWPLRSVSLWLLAFLCLVVAGVYALRTVPREQAGAVLSDRRQLLRSAWDVCAPWLAGICLITLCMVPIFQAQPGSTGFLTTFTLGNNDVGAYIAEATNVTKAGFGNAGLYVPFDAGAGARTKANHTGAEAYIATIASVLHGEVWKTAQIALITAFAGVFAAATCLARTLLGKRPRASLVIAAFSAGNLFALYLAGHFFAGQMLCMVFLTTQLALVIAARDRMRDPRIVLTLASLIAACLLASPELQIVAWALLGSTLVVSSLSLPAPDRKRALIESLGGLALSAGLALLLVAPFVTTLIDTLGHVSEPGTLGWVLNLHEAPLTMLGYPERLGAAPTSLGTAVLVAIGLLLAAALGLAIRARNRQAIAAGIFMVILLVIIAAGAIHWGFSAYQSWKLIMTLSVPLLIACAVLLVNVVDARLVLALAATIALVNLAAGARQWTDARDAGIRSHSVTNELATVLTSAPAQRQRELNVDLPQQFSSLTAPAIYARRAALSSNDLRHIGHGARPYACTLMDASAYNPRLGRIAYASHGYVLVDTPRCR